MNLAVNAQDAMPDGGRMTIEVGLTTLQAPMTDGNSEMAPGRYALLSVADTGHGMSAEVLEHLFTPFFTTKELGKGTGLGLATAYGIINQHGGTITVESEAGKGACFNIYLPIIESAVPEGVEQPKPVGGIQGTETVMVVEDNELVRTLTVKILEHLGYSVLSATSGSECLKLIETNAVQIDLLLTDIVMPEMNGRTLYEKLSARLPKVRVLFMSGYTGNLVGSQGVLDTKTAFIQKPFSVEALGRKVREVLGDVPHSG